eukprot:1719506-Pleurochrysis_carterae.AAC.1
MSDSTIAALAPKVPAGCPSHPPETSPYLVEHSALSVYRVRGLTLSRASLEDKAASAASLGRESRQRENR